MRTYCLLRLTLRHTEQRNVEIKGELKILIHEFYIRFEVFMAVTMKNGVFWDVTLCGSCKNRRFGGT
jgi:hypothetical protein